jgi:hypothetical protein
VPLAQQVEVVFRQIKDELGYLPSGVVFIQIRNNEIGKFGVRHFAVQSSEGKVAEEQEGLTEPLWRSFKAMAVDSLKLKKSWTHGEIYFEFARKKNDLLASVQMESNYNMANLIR